ncbi:MULTISPECIES: LuxR C-terminal-related transcriptional regulator [Thermomonosporaceae]|uniref:LuxR C-terminal-related transcriptional regulator n=1 Tax=Thermomonosporaceae TaxID=2012 RepID=UPI00255ADA11|nr:MULTISPECIES: LuxR C-terminal-related transcriptional regulator [Thermomonosporaceae]MDL4771329.1 LuxR C-terminal-related transcriptional regulator [Actinomadura xylanilytica]
MASGQIQSRLSAGKGARSGPGAAAFAPIVGRDGELGLLRQQLADPSVRLLTMTGPAGVGKTRLALALMEDLAGGSQFLDLAGHERAETVFEALSAPGETGRLIILDQAEHFTEALAAGLPRLLAERPRIRVLLVSREPLHLYGERVLRVPPLARVASVELFRQRAVAVRPGFSLASADGAEADDLCELLDDLPLAIEFAAARLKLFRPRELLNRLRDGQDVLYGGPTLSHHSSMREAIGWSYERLTGPEQAVFRRLAVHEDAFSPMAGTGIAPEIVETLVDKNLLVPVASPGDEPRFRMLNAVRSFSRDLHSPEPAEEPRTAPHTQPLTPREQEVAMLVAQGMTNRQIARRLGIAEWTAVNHVRNVMRKLNCTSRVNVAGWVIREQPVATALD